MRWEEVKERFPNEWVVLEATKAHSEHGNRYIEDVVVVDRFDNSTAALHRYSELHRQDPQREYCFFHTSRPTLIAFFIFYERSVIRHIQHVPDR